MPPRPVPADDLRMRQLSRWYLVVAAGLTALGFATATSAVYGSAVTALAAFTALGAILARPARPRARSGRVRGACSPRRWRSGASPPRSSRSPQRRRHRSTACSRQLIYVPGLVAITLMTIELTRRMGRLRIAGLEAAIGAFALGALVWALVLEPTIDRSAGAVSIPSIAYPLCDVVLLMLLLRVVFSPLLGLHAVRWLAGASLLLVTADFLYFSPSGREDRSRDSHHQRPVRRCVHQLRRGCAAPLDATPARSAPVRRRRRVVAPRRHARRRSPDDAGSRCSSCNGSTEHRTSLRCW